jgi:Patatin-like phospholipase
MSEPSTADRLDVKDRPQPYKTGEVLEREFTLIHGEDKWDPADRSGCKHRAELIRQATGYAVAHMPDLPAATEAQRQAKAEAEKETKREAERLALHAWSVRSLPDQAALCLSGGGIRSAAFALGVLQGLARQKLLHQFHYLSTVSGGGYTGSWLTAWRHRANNDPIGACLHNRGFGDFTEPTAMQRLRFNQNFLTPKVGLLSADTWAVLGTILRNLLLNWLVFLPLLTGLLLMPRIIDAFIYLMDLSDAHDWSLPAYSSFRALLGYLWVPHYAGEWIPGFADLGNWRSWVDSAAIALILLGFSVSAYHRPAAGPTTMTQTSFVKWVVLPVTAGAILMSGAIAAWLPQMTGSKTELVRWAYCGLLVYVMARLIAFVRALLGRARSSTPELPTLQISLFPLEILGWAVAGMCTGLLVGIGAYLCRDLAKPVILGPDYDWAKFFAALTKAGDSDYRWPRPSPFAAHRGSSRAFCWAKLSMSA